MGLDMYLYADDYISGWSHSSIEEQERYRAVAGALGIKPEGGITYLDNRDGSGWRKVTGGRGGPGWPHRNVAIEPGSFVIRTTA
jgi:hypothetical protein